MSFQIAFGQQLLEGADHGVARTAQLCRQDAAGRQAGSRRQTTLQHCQANLIIDLAIERRRSGVALERQCEKGGGGGAAQHGPDLSANLDPSIRALLAVSPQPLSAQSWGQRKIGRRQGGESWRLPLQREEESLCGRSAAARQIYGGMGDGHTHLPPPDDNPPTREG